MTPDEFARIKSLFHAALEQTPERRARFLDEVESDPEVRAAAQRLLDSADMDDADPVSSRLAQITCRVPARSIGPYSLLRELGAGGMGTVFLAERDVEGTAQQVALKLLHGLPTEAGKRQMARERGLLAGLNHPHIASHIDGGESPEGQPYLVMDYIEGVPLPEYLATTKPALPERLKLYLHICDAVQHAHQRLILHRDLKPSNVIVRVNGMPLLLDFGVGKLLDDSEASAHTVRAFTPGYGAPEQLRGDAATTASDVFGLGALLFDLLTDRRLPELRKSEGPVPTPSSAAQDSTRRRALRGDLDRIVHKATAENPEHRYRTAAALADDVQRYLQGQPIAAAPDATWYRLRKFIARHRVAVAAGTMIVVAASLFVWRLDTERQRALTAERAAGREAATAKREATNAKASRDFLASVLAETSPEAVRGRPITIATLLTNAVKKLQADRSQDAQARAIAWLTIAEVYADINDPQPGLTAVDMALTLIEQAAVPDPELRARALHVRGSILIQLERVAEARQVMQLVIAIYRQQSAGALALSRAYIDYGMAAMHGGDLGTAERYQLLALKMLDAAKQSDSNLYAKALRGLTACRYHQDDIDGAAHYLSRAETLAKTMQAVDDPASYKLHRLAAPVRHAQHRYAEALSHSEEALRLAYRMYGQHSRFTAEMEWYLAWMLDDNGSSRAAIPHYERSRSISLALGLGDAVLATDDVSLAMAYANLADFPRAAALIDSALPRLPDLPAYTPWHIKAHYTRGVSLSASGRYAQARPDFERALRLARAHKGEIVVGYPFVQLRHAQALLDARRFVEAEAALREAKPIEQQDLYPMALITLRSLEASLALEQGDLPTAAQRIARALAPAEKYHLVDTLPIAKAKVIAVKIAFQQGDISRARKLLGEAFPVLRRELSPKALQLVEAQQLAQQLSL